jgi:hypothetical protein
VLVLGAGGFTLSHREPLNHYTYVDIDPAVRASPKRDFLREPVRGEFVADDARAHLRDSYRRAPRRGGGRRLQRAHQHPRPTWSRASSGARRPGAEAGRLLAANLILDRALASPYARNLLATIESIYGRCAVEVLQKKQVLANVVVTCRNGPPPAPARVFIDERNTADFDLARSR